METFCDLRNARGQDSAAKFNAPTLPPLKFIQFHPTTLHHSYPRERTRNCARVYECSVLLIDSRVRLHTSGCLSHLSGRAFLSPCPNPREAHACPVATKIKAVAADRACPNRKIRSYTGATSHVKVEAAATTPSDDNDDGNTSDATCIKRENSAKQHQKNKKLDR